MLTYLSPAFTFNGFLWTGLDFSNLNWIPLSFLTVAHSGYDRLCQVLCVVDYSSWQSMRAPWKSVFNIYILVFRAWSKWTVMDIMLGYNRRRTAIWRWLLNVTASSSDGLSVTSILFTYTSVNEKDNKLTLDCHKRHSGHVKLENGQIELQQEEEQFTEWFNLETIKTRI